MAGGKETPRQKMIGMMYLVLTALLALNVSKEIVRAFVTINDKLDSSGEIISEGTGSTYDEFTKKELAIKTKGGDLETVQFWKDKSEKLSDRTNQSIHFILSENNEMIKKAEGGKSWIKEKDEETGLITELESFMKISAMDNYDIPTNRYIGGNPQKPKEKGMSIRDSIHAYRDYVMNLMANYEANGEKYTFENPESVDQLDEALKTCNKEDTAFLKQFYLQLTIPEKLKVKDAGQEKPMPWPSVMFDHAPIVAAAAMLTSLKVDVINAESAAADFMLSKVEAPSFNFNKIEPLAFARTGYINAGDSLDLKVMIAAYDSNEVSKIRYGINEDTIPENWKETEGKINLPGKIAGDYIVKGQIGVREKGKMTWKDWDFNYTVGEPSGTVSLPEMNVLYRGYDNKVKGAASGFPDYRLSPGKNISSLSQAGEFYTAKPGSAREASISISGVAADGSDASLGTFEFRVQDLPKPSVSLGRISDGESATSGQLRASRRLFAGYPPSIPLKANFSVVSWEMTVSGAPRPAEGRGANLNDAAQRMISGAGSGDMITIVTEYREPSGRVKRQNAVFKVK